MFEACQFPISKKVNLAVQNGLNFYRHAVLLKKIWNFHNKERLRGRGRDLRGDSAPGA